MILRLCEIGKIYIYITRIQISTYLDISNKHVTSCLRISVLLNFASSKWHTRKNITSVKKTKERDVTPRNSRHCLLADVTVNSSLPRVLPCHYVITILQRANLIKWCILWLLWSLALSTPVLHIRTAAISTLCRYLCCYLAARHENRVSCWHRTVRQSDAPLGGTCFAPNYPVRRGGDNSGTVSHTKFLSFGPFF